MGRSLLVLMVALLLLSAIARFEASAAISVEKVYVLPEVQKDYSGTVELNSTFRVTVMIADFIEVHGWQVQLYFNSTLLQATEARIPDTIWPDYIFFNKDISHEMIDVPSGGNYVKLGQNLTGSDSATNTTDPKRLAEVQFRRIKLPPKPRIPTSESLVSSVLKIDNLGTFVLDPSGVRHDPVSKIDGNYEYYWSAPPEKPSLEVKPPEQKYVRDPPSAVGEQFDIVVNIKNLDVSLGGINQFGSLELVSISFTLIYDPALLEVLNISEGTFMKKFGDTTFTSDTSIPGEAVVNQAYLNPPWTGFPYVGGEVARIRFSVTYQGKYPVINQSALNLTDIMLNDHYGNDIPMSTAKNSTYIIEGLLYPELKVINPQTGNGIFRFFTNTTTLGARFNVTVIATAGDLFAYQVYLTYNATLLNATKAWLPKWDNTSLPWVFFGRTIVPTAPSFYIGAVQIGSSMMDPDQPSFSGTGKLAIIEFRILAAAPTFGNISSILNVTSVDAYLLDSNLDSIPAPQINGYYEYIWAESLPGLELQPSIYTGVEQETFNVTVWLNNANASKGLVSLEFKLRYNATLLSPVQVIDGSFLAGFGFTFDYFFSVGSVKIKHYMKPPYTNFPDGSGPIATITFQGIYQDSKENNCTLEFVDILLKDENGTEMPIAPSINGFYNILPIGSSLLSINVNPDSVEVGSDIVIGGTLKPTRPNVNITIYYQSISGTWDELGTTKTDSYSNYTFTWTTTADGIYEIKASWPGDGNTNPAESLVKTVTIRAKPATIDFTLYAAIGAGITIIAAVAIAVYFLKIRKH